MWRDRRPALLGITVSLGLHLAVAVVLWRLPEPSAMLEGPSEIRVAVVGDGRSGDGTTAAADDAPSRQPAVLQPGNRASRQNVDAPRPGERGDRTGASRTVLLLEHTDAVTLQDTPMNAPEHWQTQRIRTAPDRASWEHRRATPHPADQPFLASGRGPHPERRPRAPTDARHGARVAPPATRRGAGEPSQHGGKPTPPAREPSRGALEVGVSSDRARVEAAGAADRRAGTDRPSPGRGIRHGRGRRPSQAADVAHGRPPVDEGPAATPARRRGRVRDDRDSELLAASMVQSMVEATRRQGTAAGAGRGGTPGGGSPGTAGAAGRGGSASPYGPGAGRYPALDTADARYRRWYLEQRRRIESALVFPEERQLARDQGTSVYRLLVRRDGSLAHRPKLLRSSGFDDLDAAARNAIEGSTPFPPLPPDLAPSRQAIAVTVPVEFENPMVY